VLPEDDANRQLANGFLLELDSTVLRKIQIVEVAGGWHEVLNKFESDHIAVMDRYTSRIMVLLSTLIAKTAGSNMQGVGFQLACGTGYLSWAFGASRKILRDHRKR